MSGTTGNLSNNPQNVDAGFDSVTIIKMIEDIPGGKTLDVTGFSPEIIRAGHLVIKETSSGIHKPMPVNGAAYDSLPAGHEYVGVVVASVLTTKPFVSVMVRGAVNEQAFVNGGGYSSIPAAAKTALSLIRFTKD